MANTGKPFTNSIILQTVNVITGIFALPLSHKFGRRSLLLTGFAVTSISMFCIAIVYTIAPAQHSSGQALVVLTCIFIGAYACTIGPASWIAAGELPSTHLRSYTYGVGMGIESVFAWLTSFTTPFFIKPATLTWVAKLAWIWTASNVVTFVFIYFFLPETKDRPLEELDELFSKKISARHFKRYVCESVKEPSPAGTFDEGSSKHNETVEIQNA